MKTNAVRTASVRAAEQSAGTIRHAGQALVETGKAAVAALQSVIAVLSAGGVVIVIILIIICLIGNAFRTALRRGVRREPGKRPRGSDDAGCGIP